MDILGVYRVPKDTTLDEAAKINLALSTWTLNHLTEIGWKRSVVAETIPDPESGGTYYVFISKEDGHGRNQADTVNPPGLSHIAAKDLITRRGGKDIRADAFRDMNYVSPSYGTLKF